MIALTFFIRILIYSLGPFLTMIEECMPSQIIHLLNDRLTQNKIDLPSEQKEKILVFLGLLEEWRETFNVTGHRNFEDIIDKDIMDGLYAASETRTHLKEVKTVLDVACGAGFIGLAFALFNPFKITFLDADRKRTNFIRYVLTQLQMPQHSVIHARLEAKKDQKNTPLGKYDLIVCRATWKIDEFSNTCIKYVHNDGHLLFMAGKNQKIDHPQTLELSGLAADPIISYTIKPKNYERQLIFLKKSVSREIS
ncbi:MAG TPA: hypothetical protein DDW49_07615 [Deltaproteobacteria bacterium]|nr:hypothetical protein [Deltaproteobacteria bacterium]